MTKLLKILLVSSNFLTVTGERESVAAEPGGITTTTLGLVVTVTLANSSVFDTGSSETTHFSVLVHSLADPVDAGITANGIVEGIHEDNLVKLEGGILIDPVRVEDTQVATLLSNTLLGNAAVGALELELVDTLGSRLAVNLFIGREFKDRK